MPETAAVFIETQPTAVIVHVLVPDLSENNMTRTRAGIAQAVAEEPSLPFILDMGRVKFAPSLTLGALIQLNGEFRARKQRLILVSLQPTVREAMAITRLDKVICVMDDVSAALRAL